MSEEYGSEVDENCDEEDENEKEQEEDYCERWECLAYNSTMKSIDI
jgi:hypothetical protein